MMAVEIRHPETAIRALTSGDIFSIPTIRRSLSWDMYLRYRHTTLTYSRKKRPKNDHHRHLR